MSLTLGQAAPLFTLPSSSQATRSLADFKGKNIVLYFYPKDDTPGCTLESCGFRDIYQELLDLNTVILGVSKDTVLSHKKFAQKHNLRFTIFSDVEKKVIKKYKLPK